jgi:ABC-type transport system involved in multi-copper enzyme maturation permease subunit
VNALLSTEFRRFWSRRLVRIVAALVILGILVAGVIVFATQSYDLVTLPDVFLGTSFVFVILGWLFGASFVGAEWHAGTVTTLLTWEPRRTRVIVAKVVAAVVSVFLVSLVLQAVLGGVLAVDAATQGSTAGTDGAWAADVAGVGLRVALVSCIFAGVGFGIASIGRNTAAALGVGFGYIVIVENLVRGLRPAWTPWLLTENAGLFLIGDPADFPNLHRSVLEAGLYLAAVATLLLVAAAAQFRARDVTV